MHRYPEDKWARVLLAEWNWIWNQARGNYSTYAQELLAGMLVLYSYSPVWRATLFFGCVTKNRSAASRRGRHLRRLSSDAGGAT